MSADRGGRDIGGVDQTRRALDSVRGGEQSTRGAYTNHRAVGSVCGPRARAEDHLPPAGSRLVVERAPTARGLVSHRESLRRRRPQRSPAGRRASCSGSMGRPDRCGPGGAERDEPADLTSGGFMLANVGRLTSVNTFVLRSSGATMKSGIWRLGCIATRSDMRAARSRWTSCSRSRMLRGRRCLPARGRRSSRSRGWWPCRSCAAVRVEA